MPDPVRVQFVCLGNICRSPLAKAVFRDKVKQHGLEDQFEIVSSGTSNYHVGEQADRRMRQTADRHGLSLEAHRASQFQKEDLEAFDHVFVMDKSNLNDVLHLDENDEYGGKVRLFREFDPEPGDYQVPDPYHGGRQGFENVFDIVERTSEMLLHRLIEEHDLADEAAEEVGREGG
jgi:protein-tyrosine phosphatase